MDVIVLTFRATTDIKLGKGLEEGSLAWLVFLREFLQLGDHMGIQFEIL